MRNIGGNPNDLISVLTHDSYGFLAFTACSGQLTSLEMEAYGTGQIVVPMDQITIKTPTSKCRLYWCLIDFIDWRYSQSCNVGIFDPSCELAPL
jgi:hypothetical protein